MKVIAHRGASAAAPENTMAAFRAAIACGADGVELDVRATADGELVVIHDASLDRTTDATGVVVETDADSRHRRTAARPRVRGSCDRLSVNDVDLALEFRRQAT